MGSDQGRTGLVAGSRELRRLELAMLAAALAAFAMLYFTQALLPAIARDFEVGPTASTLTVSVSTGALALTIIPLSSVADSVGRIAVMRIGLAAACVLAFAAAAAPQFWVLLVLRALLGVALAAVVAVAVGHLGDEVHPAATGAAIGVYVSGNTLGGVAGRLIPGLAQAGGHWRLPVLVLAACASVAVAAFWALVPAARRFEPTPPRLRTHVHGLVTLWRDTGVRRLCVVAFLLMGGFVACYNYLTFRLQAAPIHASPRVASLLFLAYLAGTLSSPVAGRLADRYGRRRLVLCAIAVSLAGLGLTIPDRLPFIAVGLVVFTAGFFAAHAVASGWVSTRASRNKAQAAAMYLLAYYLGSSTLGSAIGLAYEHGGWVPTCATIAVLFVLAAVSTAGIGARPRTGDV